MTSGLKWRIVLWSAVLLLQLSSGMAQVVEDSSQTSTVQTKSPGKAVIRSALLPGLGQWYNEQRFKAVLVLGGELGLIANAVYLNQKAVQSQTTWEKEFYVNNRSLSLWWFVGIYFLNLLDAYVDAHLWNFDVDPELSIQNETPTHSQMVVSICFTF